MNTFKSNRVLYLIMEGILIYATSVFFKYSNVLNPCLTYPCLIILIYHIYQITMRLIENERDYKKVIEIDNELAKLKYRK